MFVIYKSDTPVNVFVIGQRHHSQVYFAYWSLVQRSSGTGSQKRARKIQIKFSCVPPYVWIHFALLEETNWDWCLIKKRCLFGSHWRLKAQDQAAAGEDLWSIAWFHVRWIIMQSAWKDSWFMQKAEDKRQACFPRTSSSVGNARKPGRTYYSLPRIAACHLSSSLNVWPLQQCQEQASGSWTLMGNIGVIPDRYHLPPGVGRPGRLSYFNSIESWSRFNVAIRYHPVTVAVGVLMWNSEMKSLPS